MGIILKELVEQVKHMDLKLVAGKKGIYQEVRWTHMVDSEEISEFLQGQELVFTTGVGLNETLTLRKLVKLVYEKGASGIVINIGPYVSEISQDILDFAEKRNFPVFEVPWRIHLAEVMRIMCFSITKAEQTAVELSMAAGNAFQFPEHEDSYVPALIQKGYMADWSYYVAVMEIYNKGGNPGVLRMNKIRARLSSYARFYFEYVLCTVQENRIVFIIHSGYSTEIHGIMQKICEEMQRILLKDERMVVTTGMQVNGLKNIYKSYEQARKLCYVGISYEVEGEEKMPGGKCIFYENAGIWKLLLMMENTMIMQQYTEETVLPLYEYDRMKQSDLVTVVSCYLKNNGSVKDTAEQLIVHRNTVNNKVKKAEELLKKDFSLLDTRMQVLLGFAVYKMLHAE